MIGESPASLIKAWCSIDQKLKPKLLYFLRTSKIASSVSKLSSDKKKEDSMNLKQGNNPKTTQHTTSISIPSSVSKLIGDFKTGIKSDTVQITDARAISVKNDYNLRSFEKFNQNKENVDENCNSKLNLLNESINKTGIIKEVSVPQSFTSNSDGKMTYIPLMIHEINDKGVKNMNVRAVGLNQIEFEGVDVSYNADGINIHANTIRTASIASFNEMLNQNKENKSNNCAFDLNSLTNSTRKPGNVEISAIPLSSEISFGEEIDVSVFRLDNNCEEDSRRLFDVVPNSGKITQAPGTLSDSVPLNSKTALLTKMTDLPLTMNKGSKRDLETKIDGSFFIK